jgi:hypothetical protein
MLAGGFSYNDGHQEQAGALVWNERSVTSGYPTIRYSSMSGDELH